MTDEYQAAKDTLDSAVHDFYTKVSPGELITGWVLASHRVSAELDEDGSSIVGTVTPTGQRFHVSRGLLEIALDSARRTS